MKQTLAQARQQPIWWWGRPHTNIEMVIVVPIAPRKSTTVDPMSKLNHSPHCFHESQDLQGVRREALTLTNDILCLLKVRDRREAHLLAERDRNLLYCLYPGLDRCLLSSPKRKKRHTSTQISTPKQLKGTLHSNRIDKTHWNRLKYTNLGFLAVGPSCETSPLLLLGVDLGFGFGDEDGSGRDTSASPSFAATTCAFCREINCSCDIVRAEGVQLMCDYSRAIHSQAQCMGLKYIQSSNKLTTQLSSSPRPLPCFFIL